MGPCFRRDDGEYAALLPIASLLDSLDHAAGLRLPAEFAPRTLCAHPAAGSHGVFGGALAPFRGRLLHRHRRWRAGEPEHAVDRLANFPHRILAILDEVEGAGRGLVDRERIERHEIVDMYVGPDVFAGTGMRGVAALPGEADQKRHLHAVPPRAVAYAVDQA